MTATDRPRVALVLGGGALKGFAHIGALRALAEHGVQPTLFAGSSIGALVAAAAAGGMTIDEMAERALALRRKDLFRINHMGMLLDRMQSRSIYLEAPLRTLCDHIVPEGAFDDLRHRLLVTSVDLERGTELVWGTPGLRDVPVRDAVYASCALPGFFPPGAVGSRVCIDGGTTDNLPVAIAALGADAIIAVDVGNVDVPEVAGFGEHGFASVYMRAATIMMHTLQGRQLAHWHGAPTLLVRPRVSHIGWFSFHHTAELISAGYDAMREALVHYERVLAAQGGIFPRRPVAVRVREEACTGCGLCVALAPHVMALDARGKAFPPNPHLDWSPADGAFVRQCPTGAITATARDATARDATDHRATDAPEPNGLERDHAMARR